MTVLSVISKWWTRSQRIRTFAEIPFEAAILDTDTPPIYEKIAPRALQLQRLGMSSSAIAKRLGITDKTVAKAIAWFRHVQLRPDD
jgi:DNA-binding NarL/FixJ family response regulator